MAVTGKMQHQKQSLILVSFDNDFFFFFQVLGLYLHLPGNSEL